MSVAATYEVRVDLDRDLLFTGANEDLSSFWKSMSWQLGASKPDQLMSRTNTAEIVLNNSTGKFSPGHASGIGLEVGQLIRIRSTYSATTRTHFVGWIKEIIPQPGIYDSRETRVRAEGWGSRAVTARALVPAMPSATADDIITEILSILLLYPPGTTGFLLGVPTFAELGETSSLSAGVTDYANLEVGVSAFAYAGGQWGERIAAYQAIGDVVEAERGFLFEGRDGKINFYNRHHWALDLASAVDATFTQNQLLAGGIEYKYGDRLINSIIVRFAPSVINTSLTTVATLNDVVEVPPFGTATTFMFYRDSSDNQIGAYNVQCVAGVDYIAKAGEASGQDLTGYVSASVTEGAGGAEILFTNTGGLRAFIQTGMTLTGKKITFYGSAEASADDLNSQELYGIIPAVINLRLVDNSNDALAIATHIIGQRATPRSEIQRVTIAANLNDSLMSQALTRTIGDRVALSDAQVAISGAEYFIVGEAHRVDNARNHRTTWYTLFATPQIYWALGTSSISELGQKTYLTL